MSTFIDLKGKKYGRLSVIERSTNNKRKQATWKCECDCGNEIIVGSGSLRKGNTTSCGCYQQEVLLRINTTHGLAESSEYKVWVGMKQRCTNPKNLGYYNYGERGITVSDRWLHSFENFLEDMGNKPTARHSIERNDVNGDYTPENCRWATKTEQSRNQRKKKSNKTGYVGITRNGGKWVAGIGVNKKRIHLGYYSDINEAIDARKEAEIKYWGKSS